MSHAEPSSTPEPSQSNVPEIRRGRRWLRWILGILCGLFVLVLCMPYVMDWGPARRVLLSVLFRRTEGTINVEQASVGWFSPIALRKISVRSPDNQTVMSIEEIEADRPLWQLVFAPSNLGTWRITEPTITSRLAAESQFSLATVFQQLAGPQEDKKEEDSPAQIPNISAELQIVDGRLVIESPATNRSWNLGDLRLEAGLERSAKSDAPNLIVKPGTVLNHLQLSEGLCNDVLKYIAPTVAGATRVEGEFSIELGAWHIPLNKPEEGELTGRLTIHHAELAAGPVATALANLIGIDPKLQFEDDSVIDFKMLEGRVHHSQVEFQLGPLMVRTTGSVGLDQTLDLVAEVQMPDTLTGDGPLRRALASQVLTLPIGGTLSQPVVDGRALGASTAKLLLGTLDELLHSGAITGEALEQRLSERGLLQGGLLEQLLSNPPLPRERAGRDGTEERPRLFDGPFRRRLRERYQ